MKRLILATLLVAGSAQAAMGFLVGSSTTTIGGKMYTVCTYQVGQDRINQMLPYPNVCPPSINL